MALVDTGPNVGLELTEWRRDKNAWEDWSSHPGTGRIRPDAYVALQLHIEGEDGASGAFIEFDFATMHEARLRTKVGRRGLEPLTPCASCKCATNCANGP